MKKIINIKSGILASSLIASIAIGGLCGYANREQVPNDEQETTNNEVIERPEVVKMQGTIIDDKQILIPKEYKASDILVISVYDPIMGKDRKFLVNHTNFDDKIALPRSYYLNKFDGTVLAEKINNYETKLLFTDYYIYESVFPDEQVKYSLECHLVKTEDITGIVTHENFTFSDCNYVSDTRYVYSEGVNYGLESNNTLLDNTGKVYNNEAFAIRTDKLVDVIGCDENRTFKNDELKEILTDLNTEELTEDKER